MVELALVAPLFIIFFWITVQTALLFNCQLKLVSLVREFALARDRLGRNGLLSDKNLLNSLCKLQPELDPARLDFQLESAGASSGNTPNSGFSSFLLGPIFSSFAGDRITLRYRYLFSGAAAAVLPNGLTLQETLVCKSGFFKAVF